MTTVHQRPPASTLRLPDRPPLLLRPVEREPDVLDEHRGTPIGDLLAAHNLGRSLPFTPTADLLIVTCMDHRVTLDIPDCFAYQVRTAGATPEPVLSNVAFAIAVAGVRAIAVITHTDCAMCRAADSAASMTGHLVEREGWCGDAAREQERQLRHVHRIADPISSAWAHARRLARRFPSCVVAPLLYRVDDGALLQIDRCRGALGGIGGN